MILVAMVLLLEAETRPEQRHVQGWFYGLLRQAAPGLHENPAPPPFTTAVGGGKGRYWLRVTLLDEALYSSLSPLLYPLAGKSIRLGKEAVPVRAVLHEGHYLAALSTYHRLFRGAAEHDYPFRFLSPTFFKRKGGHYPLPEPKLVFGSLYERFRSYSPAPPPAGLPEVFERITLRKLNLRSKAIEHETRGVGVTGNAVYHLPKAGNEEARWLTALWRFSFFSGVGAKTSMGFGLVRPGPLPKGVQRDRKTAHQS